MSSFEDLNIESIRKANQVPSRYVPRPDLYQKPEIEHVSTFDVEAWKRRIYPPDGIPPVKELEPEKKERGFSKKISWTKSAAQARESGLIPLSEDRQLAIREKLDTVDVGSPITLVYLTDTSHRTVEGEYVSHDEETIIVKVNSRFNKVPVARVFQGYYTKPEPES